MGIEKLSLKLAERAARYLKACGKTSILQTKAVNVSGIEGLRYAPDLSVDVVQISLKAKNTVKMTQVEPRKFLFHDGEKYIGRAVMSKEYGNMPTDSLPESWFIPNGVPDELNFLPTYPRVYVNEILISDKIGEFEKYQQRGSGKKYGTMCMQRILEWAEKNGCGSRICLGPQKHHSNIHPGKFYAKIGFEPDPNSIEQAKKINKYYYSGIKYVKEHPELPEEIREDMLGRQFIEQIDGRFVSTQGFGGTLCLTHPEVLKNYPL